MMEIINGGNNISKDGVVYFQHVQSGLFLDGDGQRFFLHPGNWGDYQQFTLQMTEQNRYQIIQVKTNKALDSNTQGQVYPLEPGASINQCWKVAALIAEGGFTPRGPFPVPSWLRPH